MKTEKLIEEYRKKIANQDRLIEMKVYEMRAARDQKDYIYLEQLRPERKGLDTQRQCYVQFIADLESLGV